jgi:hypothetical protein
MQISSAWSISISNFFILLHRRDTLLWQRLNVASLRDGDIAVTKDSLDG